MGLLEKALIGLTKKAAKHVAVDVITGKNKTANNIKRSFENSIEAKVHEEAGGRKVFSMDHFNLNGESVVTDSDREIIYHIEKTKTGKEIRIYDKEYNMICKITGSETSAKIKNGRNKIGEVQSNFSLKGSYFTTSLNQWKITSDLLGFKYSFLDHDKLIAQVDMKCLGGKCCYFYLNNYDDIKNVLFIHSAINVILAYSIEITIEASKKREKIERTADRKEENKRQKQKKQEKKEAKMTTKMENKKRYADVYEPIASEEDVE